MDSLVGVSPALGDVCYVCFVLQCCLVCYQWWHFYSIEKILEDMRDCKHPLYVLSNAHDGYLYIRGDSPDNIHLSQEKGMAKSAAEFQA